MIADHPHRFEVANELHARPFPSLEAPCHAVFLAVKRREAAASRDRGEDRAHLLALLDRFGAQHPAAGATHFFGTLGRHRLKWECHTEFVTYTLFGEGIAPIPFDASSFGAMPTDWLATAPGDRLTSALVRVATMADDATIDRSLNDWFDGEGLAVARVLDGSAVVASDFRIDANGHTRFSVFADPDMGPRRLGQIVQRLIEIETYKTIAMLGLPVARELSSRLSELDAELADLVSRMRRPNDEAEATLDALLAMSARIEHLLASNSFRFGATAAYEAIVAQRIEVMREEHYGENTTFAEFMMRRFDPAMRTIRAAEERLEHMAERSRQAASLLLTRVEVGRSAENQALLASMDRRADLQLRLQRTVEGLSVVAISYYAVNLLANLAKPVGPALGLGEGVLLALLTPPVVALVWILIRRIRKGMS
ncbi:MAG: DUF3422 domain-containing protein [Gammaproteobacteria bacterium]|nr:DUF3422 domain-containing protein [Gammaproteobacteria bacterium]